MILHDWDDALHHHPRQLPQSHEPQRQNRHRRDDRGRARRPRPAALIDMNMLAVVPGQERSLIEYDALLTAAGLHRTALVPTSSAQSVIEAVSV
jgi:hypothetical protein